MVALKSTVTSKGQITLPKPVREALGLERASVVEFELQGEEAILRPAKKGFLSRFASLSPQARPEDWRRVREATAEQVGKQAAEEGR